MLSMNSKMQYVDWLTQPIHIKWTGWLAVINSPEVIGWICTNLEDWLIVMGMFIQNWIFFCPRHNLSSKWRTGWLSKAYSSWSWYCCVLCSLTFWLIVVKPWTQPILHREDWLIVQGWFHPFITSLLAWLFGGFGHNLSSRWRTGWLSKADSAIFPT